MSDFFNQFWPYYIAAISLIGILACGWLAWHYARPNPAEDATADVPGEHVWDGDLRETNQPLPRWFVWGFYLTVIFSLGYLALYPGLVIYDGSLGWTQSGQHEAQKAALDARTEAAYAEFADLTPEELATNQRALTIGNSLFLNNCALCHGSDARGTRGYPNLADGDWLWGGDAESIYTSIAQGRHGLMPPMAPTVGTATDVRNVAAYVLSLSGSRTDNVAAAQGRAKFAATCAACHGADGTGNTALGAPNLTDRIWTYGGSEADIIDAINNGREGVMPPHEGRLSSQQIELLVAYLLNASGAVRQ